MDIPRKREAEHGRNIPRELYNRQVMLQRVQDSWVHGVLEKSLHNEVLIRLGIEEKRDVVRYQVEMTLQHPDRPGHILEPGTKIIDVLDECQSLLILGEPGSGKTTTLLELTRQAIACARTDPTRPLPVVFNLSSWAKKQPPLGEWLLQELNSLYNIPKKMAEAWIETNAMVLCLDGLDEVAPEDRAVCVQAINYFRRIHPVPIAVCGCIADYDMLSTQLSVPNVIFLEPLKSAQIDTYLENLGADFAAVRTRVKQDEVLQKLAENPLMLNLISLAYGGKAAAELQGFDNIRDSRRNLFDEFIKQMFRSTIGPMDKPYSDQQVLGWLSRLAQKMAEQSKSIFLVEQIQPSWLSTYLHQGIFAFSFRLLVVSSVAVLIWLLIWPLFTLYFEHVLSFYRIVFGGGIVVSIWMLFYYLNDDIKPSDAISWSWKTAMRDLRLRFSLAFGLILTSLCSLTYPAGFVLFLWVTWLSFFTLGGLSSTDVKLEAASNYPLWQSTRNCTRIWLLFLLGYGGFFGLLFAVLGIPVTGVLAAIGVWVIIGLIGGLKHGGLAVIQHYILRLLLYFEKQAPLNYTRFLDYCQGRILLRRVGGGYIFIHPLLLEHFSAIPARRRNRMIEAQSGG